MARARRTEGRLFEETLGCLRLAGLQQIEWRDVPQTIFPDFYCEHYPYTTIYGTRGKHEWLVHTRRRHLVFEFKYQEVSGSTDEKLPYLVESWQHATAYENYPMPNDWLVAFGGSFWETPGRGRSAVDWIRRKAKQLSTKDKRLYVTCGIPELHDQLQRLFC